MAKHPSKIPNWLAFRRILLQSSTYMLMVTAHSYRILNFESAVVVDSYQLQNDFLITIPPLVHSEFRAIRTRPWFMAYLIPLTSFTYHSCSNCSTQWRLERKLSSLLFHQMLSLLLMYIWYIISILSCMQALFVGLSDSTAALQKFDGSFGLAGFLRGFLSSGNKIVWWFEPNCLLIALMHRRQ